MIQVFGTKKCSETAKAVRFFKERRIEFQLIDLAEKGMSKGELRNISRVIPLEDLIDTGSRSYEKKNLKYIKHDIEEELLKDGTLFRTPVVRDGSRAAVGYRPGEWKKWIENK